MSNLAEATEYISNTKYLILATVGTKDFPGLRTLLSFANDVARNPSFKARVEQGQLSGNTLFRVHPHKVKLLDFRKGIGSQAVEELAVYEN